MRQRLLPIAILAAILAGIATLQLVNRSPRTGYEAADFELSDLDGKVHRLSDYRGQIVFLNMWTTWCPPCRDEMPGMEALYRELRGSGLVMLAVSEDEAGASAVAPFVRELGLSFPVLLEPEGKLSPRYGVTGYPETFIIGRDGKVLEHLIGPTAWSSPERVAYFRGLLDRPAAAPAG
jgi:peroxiredoxin